MSELLQTVTIKLVDKDLLELQQILVDDDAENALLFLKKTIAKQLPQKGGWSCNSNNMNQYL